MLRRFWTEEDGVLTLEWIILTTLVVLGVIGGLAVVRDALMHELGGVVGAAMALDQTATISDPIAISIGGGIGCSPSVAGSPGGLNESPYVGTDHEPGGIDPITGLPIAGSDVPNFVTGYDQWGEGRYIAPGQGINSEAYTGQTGTAEGGCTLSDLTSQLGP
jgi:Flp pilus assembly pilin Flp